jgi:hypothetical protein
MEESPSSKVTTLSATEEIPPLVWASKDHKHVHNSMFLDPILNQYN